MAKVREQKQQPIYPPAGISQRHKYRKQADGGMAHVGIEWVREARCPYHRIISREFVGVGDDKWGFICVFVDSGSGRRERHHFYATPPLYKVVPTDAQS